MSTLAAVERIALDPQKFTATPHTGRASDKLQSSLIPGFESRWPLAPALPELASQELHVWCAGLDELTSDLPSFAQTLSAGERNRAERFQFDRDRNRFIVRRGLLRTILG